MVVEEVCTITAKGQTTVPRAVRRALGLHQGSRIAFRVEDRGVSVHAVEEDGADPALAPFLDLIARDMAARPEALVALSPGLAARIRSLTGGLVVHPDEPIEGDVAL